MLSLTRLEVRYLEQLPEILHEVIEIRAFAAAEEPLLEALWRSVYQSIDNNFVLTADEEGVRHYEMMLNLKVPASDSLETRRLRILARMQEQAPYTWIVLNRILTSLLGAGNFVLTRDVAAKLLSVRLELTIRRQYDILAETLERIVPVNMIIDIGLRYNTHAKLSKYTHAELSAFTQFELRDKEGL